MYPTDEKENRKIIMTMKNTTAVELDQIPVKVLSSQTTVSHCKIYNGTEGVLKPIYKKKR